MKWMRFGLVSLFVLAMASTAMADDKTDTKPAATKGEHAKSWGSPEDMAKQAMPKWTKTLTLTPDQQPQFEAALKESYEKMADARKDAAGDKDKMKASMQTIMTDRDAAIGKILTPDQMKIYQAKVKEMAGKMKEHYNKASKDAKTDTKTDTGK